MKAASVIAMRVLPPPKPLSVPEAQPPPSCMPTPKRKAPRATETPTGATAPERPWPKALPWASSGAKTMLASASIRSCARTPAPRPSTSRRRVDEAKPKSA